MVHCRDGIAVIIGQYVNIIVIAMNCVNEYTYTDNADSHLAVHSMSGAAAGLILAQYLSASYLDTQMFFICFFHVTQRKKM